MKLFNSLNVRKVLNGDLGIWAIFIFLSILSLLEVYSSCSRMTYAHGNFYAPAISHGFFLLGGLTIAWVGHKCPYKVFLYLGKLTFLVSIIALLYTLAFGGKLNGAARWATIAGVSVQPSELAKLGLILWVSSYFSSKRDPETGRMTVHNFWKVVGCTILTCGLIVTENMSTAILIATTMVMMTWVAQPPRKEFTLCVSSVVILGLSGLLFLSTVPTETAQEIADAKIFGTQPFHRLTTWVNRLQGGQERPEDPNEFDLRRDMQKTHAVIAVATSGTIFGKGLGHSTQCDYLPHAYSDFIYSIVIEEGGLALGAPVMLAYLTLLFLSWRIARRCKNPYPCYAVMGLALMLVLQALYNMGVAVGLLPVTGQPLPLMSKGGTSVLVTSVYIGFILSVSHTAKLREKKKPVAFEVVDTMLPAENEDEKETK